MLEKTIKQKGMAALMILAVLTWAGVLFAGSGAAEANNFSAQCPNAPLRADLTGAASGGQTPSGMAMFRERGSNRLTVTVRAVDANDNTALTVMVGDTNIGTITVGRDGNGQLNVDSASGIDEGTTIAVMNGTTTVLSGTFACVGDGNTNTNTNMNTNTSPTTSPTATPTTSPTTSPTDSPTILPTVSPTPTMTPGV